MALRRPWLRQSSDAHLKQEHRMENAHPRRTTMPQQPSHEHHPIGCCPCATNIPGFDKPDISVNASALGSDQTGQEAGGGVPPATRRPAASEPMPAAGGRRNPVADRDRGFITRRGLVGFGGVAGGAVATVAASAAGPLLAILIGAFAALTAAAALHELLPKHW